MKQQANSAVNSQNVSQWRVKTLGDYVASRSKGIIPNKMPNTLFELTASQATKLVCQKSSKEAK